MILTPDQLLSMKGSREWRMNRAGVGIVEKLPGKSHSYRWPNGIIPYELPNIFEEHQRARIILAIRTLTLNTCLQFIGKTTETDFVTFRVNFLFIF